MFFLLLFLVAASLAAFLFPDWHWIQVLALSAALVVAARLALHFVGRKAPPT
jgi:hypothetical protein